MNARKIGLINVPPLGCLPIERTLHYPETRGKCVEEINEAASGFNEGLNVMIQQLKPVFPGLNIVSLDYYSLILDFIQNPGKSGKCSSSITFNLFLLIIILSFLISYKILANQVRLHHQYLLLICTSILVGH